MQNTCGWLNTLVALVGFLLSMFLFALFKKTIFIEYSIIFSSISCLQKITEPLANIRLKEKGYYPKSLLNLPIQQQWDKLIACGEIKTYTTGQVIINQSSYLQRIYHIVSGECRGQKHINHKSISSVYEVGTLYPGDTLGVASLIIGSSMDFTVIAAAPVTQVAIIDAQQIKQLFDKERFLAACFMKYFCCNLERRLYFNE